jgi:hypothetical protein
MGLGEADPAELVQTRIADHLRALVDDGTLEPGEVHDRTRDFLSEALDAPLAEPTSLALAIARGEPGEMAERLARLVAWLCAECARRLVLVVLDDLQWATPERSAISIAPSKLSAKPLMVVTFARRKRSSSSRASSARRPTSGARGASVLPRACSLIRAASETTS